MGSAGGWTIVHYGCCVAGRLAVKMRQSPADLGEIRRSTKNKRSPLVRLHRRRHCPYYSDFSPPPSSDRFSDRGQYWPTLVEDADFCLLIFETAKIMISASDLRKSARTPSDEHAVCHRRRHCQSNLCFSVVEKLSRYEILTALYLDRYGNEE